MASRPVAVHVTPSYVQIPPEFRVRSHAVAFGTIFALCAFSAIWFFSPDASEERSKIFLFPMFMWLSGNNFFSKSVISVDSNPVVIFLSKYVVDI